MKHKIIQQAKKLLDDFGIDWTIYQNVTAHSDDNLIWNVTWTNIYNNKISLTNIIVDNDGTIIQAGNNYGELVF